MQSTDFTFTKKYSQNFIQFYFNETMLKKLFYLSLILCVSGSCFAKKPKISNPLFPESLPRNIEYSDGFKQFWKDLAEESRGLKSLGDYMPSNTMKRTYLFVVMPDGEQGIEGFIQTMPLPSFDILTFEKLGGYVVFYNEGVYKFKMPVKSFVKMLDVKGVVQIDIPRKVRK